MSIPWNPFNTLKQYANWIIHFIEKYRFCSLIMVMDLNSLCTLKKKKKAINSQLNSHVDCPNEKYRHTDDADYAPVVDPFVLMIQCDQI